MPAFQGKRRIVDPVLSNVSMGWTKQNETVSDVLFPVVRTTTRSGKYYVFSREAFAPNFGGDIRAEGSRANRVPGKRVSEDEFYAYEHALEQDVPDEELEETSGTPLQPFTEATENVTDMIDAGREVSTHNMVTDPDIYAPDSVVTLAGGDQFDDYANSDPLDVFLEAHRAFRRATGTIANVTVMPFFVASYLANHPKVVERFIAQGGTISLEQLAEVLNLSRIFVPGGYHDESGNPGRPSAITELWKTDVVMALVPPRPARKTPAFGYEFVHPINGRTATTDRRYDDDIIATIIRVRRRYEHKIVAKNDDDEAIAGYLIKDAISEAAANG